MRTLTLAALAACLACAPTHANEVLLLQQLADNTKLCKVAADANNLADALLFCGRANEIQSVPVNLVNLGSALYMKGRYAEAERNFIKAMNIDPKLAVAHFDLGRAYEMLGKKEQAFEEYQRAQKLNDSDAAEAIAQLFPLTAEIQEKP